MSAGPRREPVIVRAHAFVVRDGRILVLEQAGGSRWWEAPGGTVEPGELPEQAIVREVVEETGLHIETPHLLRRWWHENRRGDIVDCYAYAAECTDGEIVLSDEHTAFAWMTAERYADRYCGEALFTERRGWVRTFMAEIRANCALLESWQSARVADAR